MSILENLGGFLLSPSRYLREFSLKPENLQQFHQKKDKRFLWLFINLVGILLGTTLVFFFLYPEVYWYPDTLKTGPKLLILYAVSPTYLILAFLVGYLIVIFDTNLINRLIYRIIYCQKQKKLGVEDKLSYQNSRELIAVFSYGWIPIVGFCLYTTIQMYWFEKINYAKIFFPYIDFSEWNIVHLLVLVICMGRKFQIEYLIARHLMRCSWHQALTPIIAKILVLGTIIIIISLVMNTLIMQFA